MIQANMHQAKTQLSKLIERAQAGEEVVIARNGKPAVRLQPIESRPPKAGWIGMFEGKMAHVPTWEEWQESDLDVALLFGPDYYSDEAWADIQQRLKEREAR